MKKFATLASSVVLSIAASSSYAALYDVELTMTGSISGGGGGSLFGSATGTYDDVTEIMNLTFAQEVTSNGFFGIGQGVADQTGVSVWDFAANTGTNTVNTCVNSSGNSCNQVPVGEPQTLQSLTDINFNTMTFTATSFYLVATTTTNWTITSYTPQVVPVPAAAWLFGSALLGLTGLKRRKA